MIFHSNDLNSRTQVWLISINSHITLIRNQKIPIFREIISSTQSAVKDWLSDF